ncbi:hypothetical protein EON76_00240 [bacterium]|nr:MAG: hypothetical protein EON76_00240 [bacterium]
MSTVNIVRAIDASKNRSTAYTPLYEAIVNSLEAIRETGRKDGSVELVFYREQIGLGLEDGNERYNSPISGVDIIDNGIGFTDDNTESFDELHSAFKEEQGGKGYGRVFYKRYFNEVTVESVFSDEAYDSLMYRSFEFTTKEFTDNQILSPLNGDEESEPYTRVSLRGMATKDQSALNLTLNTISRKLLEHLLSYFVDDSYVCPRIILRDDNTGESEVLNDYFTNSNQIVEEAKESFKLTSPTTGEIYDFTLKIFKIFFSQSASSVFLTGHQRVVTKTSMHEYRNEFKTGFYETEKKDKGKTVQRNYIVATYVAGDYLDSNVSGERGEFLIKTDVSSVAPLSQKSIEEAAVDIAAKHFKKDVQERHEKKTTLVAAHVTNTAPWLRPYVAKLDYAKIHYDAKPDDINSELQRIKFEDDLQAKRDINGLIESPPNSVQGIQAAMEKIGSKVTDIGKVDLIQHVVLRKAVIDLFAEALKWDEQQKYRKEDAVHNIIFPMHNTTDEIKYDEHNLWMIDERLSFHDYAASDITVVDKKRDKRPDIVVFDRPILVRDSNTLDNPITVIEFKKPMRTGYKDDDADPLRQIRGYVDKIRSGQYRGRNGRAVKASAHTPAYGYVIADLTPKVIEFCRDAQLVEDPDQNGYHGYHSQWHIYFEVISFDKLLSNAELRNKILFHKLNIV